MNRTFAIDFLPESARRFGPECAVVAVDVIRATTTAITALATGRRCICVSTAEEAFALRRRMPHALLAGELAGETPPGFDITNSPAEVGARTDVNRPLILLSSSGTPLVRCAESAAAIYIACFRNPSATAAHLAANHDRVGIVGAGSRNEFREEDQICCAWIGARLEEAGFVAADDRTAAIVARWRNADARACTVSNSVRYLTRSDQLRDLDFILARIDDVPQAFVARAGEIMPADLELPATAAALTATLRYPIA